MEHRCGGQLTPFASTRVVLAWQRSRMLAFMARRLGEKAIENHFQYESTGFRVHRIRVRGFGPLSASIA